MQWARLVGAWVVAIVVVSACGQTRHSGGEPGARAGPQTSAGTGDDADGPPKGGEGGAAGSVATGGASGDAGAAGAGGDTYTPADHGAVGCDGKSITLNEEQVRRCVLVTSCTGGRRSPASTEALRLGECVTNGLAFQDVETGGDPYRPGTYTPLSTPWSDDVRLAACTGTLETCDDVLACAGFRAAVGECDINQKARCVGDLAITCSDSPLVVDCAKTTGKTGTCQVLGSGATARAACVVKDNCDPASALTECDGDVTYRCDASGVGVGADCASFGQKCFHESGRIWGGCAPPPPPASNCTGSEFDCNGDTLTFCTPGGKRYDIDCAAGGDFACFRGEQEPPNALIYGCQPKGCKEASSRIEADDCDGDDVVIGLGDDAFDIPSEPPTSHARVHCPDYGFATCRDGRCVN